jgi:hypothetical protein
MILWKGKERLTAGRHAFPCRAVRWAFEIGRWKAGFVWQRQWVDTLAWKSTGAWYGVVLGGSFLLGSHHAYYDGPNCSFSLGWLHICWSGGISTGWCGKCMPPENDDHHEEASS